MSRVSCRPRWDLHHHGELFSLVLMNLRLYTWRLWTKIGKLCDAVENLLNWNIVVILCIQRQKSFLFNFFVIFSSSCLQCFDAVGWVAGRASGLWKTEWWGACMAIYLERGAGLHVSQLMPLPLTISNSSKIEIGFYFSGTGSPR